MADPRTFDDTTDRVESNAKIIAASPRRRDFADGLGKRRRKYLKESEDGKWDITIPRDDLKGVAILKDLTSGSRSLQAEHAQEFGARRAAKSSRVRMRTKDGRLVHVEAENERWLHARTGAVPAPRYRGIEVYAGPDGMLFRDIAGYWYPTGRTCLGTPVFGDGIARGPQRDPDGNTWELNPETGDWYQSAWVEGS